jgi:uncharacterized protein YecT (DUF1311 family)
MLIDRGGDPWSGTIYKGFAGGAAAQTEPPPRRGAARVLTFAGVSAALAVGAAVGFWLRPELIGELRAHSPLQTAALDATDSAQVPIAMPPLGALASPPQGKLETLPPEMAAAERAPVRPHEPAAAAPRKATEAAPEGDAQDDHSEDDETTPGLASLPPAPPHPPAARAAAPAAPPSDAPAPPPEPTVPFVQHAPLSASFDCAAALPGAEQLVCSDPALAAADRELSRAYRRALRAGVDPAWLGRDQQDWRAIREDAARHSRRAVANIYDQRIQELDQFAASSGAVHGTTGDDDQ